MMTRAVTLPELALIAAARGMFGAGAGLLLAERMTPDERRAVGRVLVLVGIVATVPLLRQVLVSRRDRRQLVDVSNRQEA